MKRLFPARRPLVLFIALSIAVFLNGCGGAGKEGKAPPLPSNASYNPGYGPFDQNGNYIEAWADKPARQRNWARQVLVSNTSSREKAKPSSPVSPRPNKPVTKPRPVVASREKIESKPPVASSPQRPKPATPKPVAKPVAKPKPATRHTVVKGDTLYSLGRRYGTSVGAIQRANGLSGTLIKIGQRLRIPQ